MKNKDLIILEKILLYIDELEEFIDGYDINSFSKDRKTINACVFNLSQIGELTSKLSDEIIKNNSQIEWRGLKSLRNRIVHDYDGVNLNMIWGFLVEELGELKDKIKFVYNSEDVDGKCDK